MSASIEKQLAESLRDAQLAFYLSDIVPEDATLKSLNIAEHLKTAGDLYHYWLLDVLVSQDVPTSLVACATASLQQYITSILNNMEPGYHTTQFPKDQVETWRTVMHHYSTWAANQRVHYFPALYLDPTLRNLRTASFQQLENDINQNQVSAESVQTAVLAYLSRFEEVANLTTINGYIDGEDFANSTYYFIAKSPTAGTYYWRSLDMSRRPSIPGSSNKYDAPEPQAWSDWERINLPISESAIEHTIRPVMFNNRLYVIWAECIFQDKPKPSDSTQSDKDPNRPLFRLHLCYKKYDGSWSAPQTYLQGQGLNDELHSLNSTSLRERTQTIAIQDQSHSPDSLFICVYVYQTGLSTEQIAPLFMLATYIDKDSKAEQIAELSNIPELPTGWQSNRTFQSKYSSSASETAPEIKTWNDAVSGTTEFIDFGRSAIHLSDYSHPPRQKRAPIRLNITFAKHLIERAETSMDSLLSWDAQTLKEPVLKKPGTPDKMDFYGAYGRYFVELFLYLPWVIAHRFNVEGQYSEAERWLHYLFNPGRKAVKDKNPEYWNAVVLQDPDIPALGQTTYAIQGPQDPHQIALSHPVHFRKALYMLYIDILLNRGDAAYRTLTPDGLTEAKLWYIRAQDLMGPRPDLKQTDLWTTVKLKDFSTEKNEELRAFENKLGKEKKHQSDSPEQAPQMCIRPFAPALSVHTIDTPHLRLPFNPVLIARWEKLESRLHNLRHNLDIVGRPMRIPLFAASVTPDNRPASNPQRAAEPGINERPGSEIPPYRFSTLHTHAMLAVETVIQFGATLLSFIERSEQANYQELQQHHIWDLANIAVDLQTQALKIDQKNKEALLASKAIVQARLDYYSGLVNDGVNSEEIAAAAAHLTGRIAEASAHAAHVVAQGLKVVPNIFGLADGGHRIEGVPFAVMAGAQGLAAAAHGTGEVLERAAHYRRRHQEWVLARDQARLEIKQFDAQLALEVERETASLLLLRQTQTSLRQARTSYDFLSKRFTSSQMYQWFTYQLSGFYYQVYDATLSLCQLTERCWRYEMVDYSAQPFFQPQAWNSTYRGLGPGEGMKLGLLKMKSAYLLGNERELEIRKTVSLRQLHAKGEIRKGVTDTSAPSINKPWDDSIGTNNLSTKGVKSTLIDTGSCEFELTQALYDNDYPGHCLRRIKSISISLPALLGPYEDIRATLTQTSSGVVMPGADKTLMTSLRANQQIALSTGIDDSGLFTLSFQDERYLPFEYTGAVSRWQLSFPNHAAQKSMLESLTDIIVHVQYTARANGGAQ
ncbi:neuraminidase-like domain-containing protein [Pseudomonas sp.]|uniref:Tc toxin subunit A-related protein n=1 Tax=Pseudomonas sp. TaxID=306 RepID=UPI003F31967C